MTDKPKYTCPRCGSTHFHLMTAYFLNCTATNDGIEVESDERWHKRSKADLYCSQCYKSLDFKGPYIQAVSPLEAWREKTIQESFENFNKLVEQLGEDTTS